MITFKSLITGDFESEADREVAPFIMFLGFPVIGPAMLGYGLYKGSKALYYHNPIRTMAERKRSIKMIENGMDPFIVYPSKKKESDDDYYEYMMSKLNDRQKENFIKDSERIIKKTREYNPYLDKNHSSVKIHKAKEEVIKSAIYKPKKLVLKNNNINNK